MGALFKAFGGSPAAAAPALDEGEEKPLSSDEVQRIAGGKVPVIRYPDLASYASWDALLNNPRQAVIVLFLVESATSGHWICAFNNAEGAHVFDPIGVALDSERRFLQGGMAQELGETEPQFARLLHTTGLKKNVSRVDFQKNVPNVNTCGRWTGLRLKEQRLPDSEFASKVHASISSSGLTPDEWVVFQTS